MFKGEKHNGKLVENQPTATFSLCCSDGNVKIPPIKDPPQLLQTLLTGKTHRDRNFCQNIRAYNSSLAFAALGLIGQEYQFRTAGPYCYCINGQLYHTISQLQPETGKPPGLSQIYIYDQQHELDYHMRPFPDLDRSVVKELQDMIKTINPYAHTYLQVSEVMNQNPTGDIQLVLRSPGAQVDPRRYNLPTGTDVAVIMPVDTQAVTSTRDEIIYKTAAHHPTGKSLMTIETIHPMYDPLMYVLIFPFGDKGFEPKCHPLSKTKKGEMCTAKQYYKYRLMPRSGETFNTIHRMGQLFQQYVVDMYAKIECSRLDYIRYNQNHLQAELYQGLTGAVENADGQLDGSQIGKKVTLPSSFTGSPRYQHQLYQDAMAIV